MELRDLIFSILGFFFLFTLFGTAFNQIFNNYSVNPVIHNNQTNFTVFANDTGFSSNVKEISQKMKDNPFLTVLTLPVDALLLFFKFIDTVSTTATAIGYALQLPPFISDYLLLYITIIIVFALYYALTRGRF